MFLKVLDTYYNFFVLFHGKVRDLFNGVEIIAFQSILDDFTKVFDTYFFTREYEKNFFWNV